MEKFIGHIEYILYSTEDLSFTIARFVTDNDIFVVRGFIPSPSTGVDYEIEGAFEMHAKYGKQFKLQKATIIEPESEADVLRFLSSGIVKGIGGSTASLIVEKLGAESLDIIENDPEKLLSIKGIGKKKMHQIHESYLQNVSERKNLMFFYSMGIGNDAAARIIETLGPNAAEMVKLNPYILMDEVRGFAFKKADDVASRLGIAADSEFRIRAMLVYILTKQLGDGHTYMAESELLNACMQLGVQRDRAEEILVKMKGKLVFLPEGRVSLAYVNEAERSTAEYLHRIVANAKPLPSSPDFLEKFERKIGIGFDEKQREAIELIFREGVYAITGGPGTGKTTIVNAIIGAFEDQKKVVYLAAPTGRAAKKLASATKRPASTIHRLLGSNGEFFAKNEEDPLDCDALIVDEVSMVDVFLMANLLSALRPETKLILVGDKNQLPSVGAGSVLRDIIQSGVIKVITLERIFRQSEKSMISINADRIINGKMPEKGNDFYFFPADIYSDSFPKRVVHLIAHHIPDYFKFDPLQDIQCLSVKYDASAGVNILNELLQEKLNPLSSEGEKVPTNFSIDSSKYQHAEQRKMSETTSPENTQKFVKIKNKTLRIGDKVMQTVNNYKLEWRNSYGEKGEGVFNGDIGTITEINTKEEYIEVVFDDVTARYSKQEAADLTLAYAITVHKSQGSEYPCVVMPIYSAFTMENRNILYTAITRAKSLVVLIGDGKALQRFVSNRTIDKRRSTLSEKLQDLFM